MKIKTMEIFYEANPPKIPGPDLLGRKSLENTFSEFARKIDRISSNCDGIHITDSVLGIPRISPIFTAHYIRKKDSEIPITTSLRVRDRNLTSISQFMADALLLDIQGVLVLKGDSPPEGPKDSGLSPSGTIRHLKESGFTRDLNLYLSIPANPNFEKIQKKIECEPDGFITQVIHSEEQIARIVDKLKPDGFRVVPIVLYPSKKNQKAADFLKIDLDKLEENFAEFVKKVDDIAGEVLITSPNDFEGVNNFLKSL